MTHNAYGGRRLLYETSIAFSGGLSLRANRSDLSVT
jgi:hypothetical protein